MTASPLPSPRLFLALLGLTLIASVLHFADNVWYFAEYPEPAWLSPPAVALLWLPLAWPAVRAWRCAREREWHRAYLLAHGFVAGNLLSLGHYLFAAPWDISARINLAILVQACLAGMLLALTVYRQARHAPNTLGHARRAWAGNLGVLALLVLVLEWFWPSRFSLWWLPGGATA